MTSQHILTLLQRREELLKDLNEVNAQIIRMTLDLGNAASLAVTATEAARTKRGAAAETSRRRWFERGEMVELARKILTEPMSQADLVRQLSTAKGYDKGLPASEKARFKSAAYQAIAAALNAKQLVRNKQGQVALRR